MRSIQNYALVADKADKKLAVIKVGRSGASPIIPPSLRTWAEIVNTSDKTLVLAASKGLFTEYEITRETIAKFKKTGQRLRISRAL